MVSHSAVIRSRGRGLSDSDNIGMTTGANMDGNIYIATNEGGDMPRIVGEEAGGKERIFVGELRRGMTESSGSVIRSSRERIARNQREQWRRSGVENGNLGSRDEDRGHDGEVGRACGRYIDRGRDILRAREILFWIDRGSGRGRARVAEQANKL